MKLFPSDITAEEWITYVFPLNLIVASTDKKKQINKV